MSLNHIRMVNSRKPESKMVRVKSKRNSFMWIDTALWKLIYCHMIDGINVINVIPFTKRKRKHHFWSWEVEVKYYACHEPKLGSITGTIWVPKTLMSWTWKSLTPPEWFMYLWHCGLKWHHVLGPLPCTNTPVIS